MGRYEIKKLLALQERYIGKLTVDKMEVFSQRLSKLSNEEKNRMIDFVGTRINPELRKKLLSGHKSMKFYVKK